MPDKLINLTLTISYILLIATWILNFLFDETVIVFLYFFLFFSFKIDPKTSYGQYLFDYFLQRELCYSYLDLA